VEDLVSPSRLRDEGYLLPFVTKAKQVADVPVGGVGLIKTPETAEKLLADEKLDLISMARQSIADPHWPRKLKAGNTDRIRECICCNQCIGQTLTYTNVIYTTNPTVDKEREGESDAVESVAELKEVLVFGASPAGLECARVAGECCHRV